MSKQRPGRGSCGSWTLVVPIEPRRHWFVLQNNRRTITKWSNFYLFWRLMEDPSVTRLIPMFLFLLHGKLSDFWSSPTCHRSVYIGKVDEPVRFLNPSFINRIEAQQHWTLLLCTWRLWWSDFSPTKQQNLTQKLKSRKTEPQQSRVMQFPCFDHTFVAVPSWFLCSKSLAVWSCAQRCDKLSPPQSPHALPTPQRAFRLFVFGWWLHWALPLFAQATSLLFGLCDPIHNKLITPISRPIIHRSCFLFGHCRQKCIASIVWVVWLPCDLGGMVSHCRSARFIPSCIASFFPTGTADHSLTEKKE